MKRLFSILSLGAALMLGSCEHKELCYDHRHNAEVDVVFDWSKAPDADPETMDIYLIPENGGPAERFQFPGRNGDRITVPLGRYHAVGINSDSETNLLRGKEHWNTFEVYTVNASILSTLGVRGGEPPRAEGTEDERVAYAPDRLWTAGKRDIRLTDPESSYTITLYPEYSLPHYTVKVINVTNLKYTYGVSGTLSSMAGGLKPGNGELTEERVLISFGGQADKEAGSISANFNGFGDCPTVAAPHMLTIYVVLSDGSKYYRSFDVTDQVHNAPDPRNVEILIDGLELPKPIINGGGFQPDVNDWANGEDIEIEM